MKKLIVFLIMLFPLVVLAQETDISSLGKADGDGISYADSLYYGTPGDSVVTIKWNNRYMLPQIYLEGNANSPVDSIRIFLKAIRYNSRGTAVDTVIGGTAVLKDSVNDPQSIAINNTVGTSYMIFQNSISILEITLYNHRGTVADRKVHFVITAREVMVKTK